MAGGRRTEQPYFHNCWLYCSLRAMRALLVAACLATTAALYADQAGEQDWHRENIGRVTHAVSKQKALFVVTEAGDRSLVASLGARTGTLNWRTALPPDEKGHAIALTDKNNTFGERESRRCRQCTHRRNKVLFLAHIVHS